LAYLLEKARKLRGPLRKAFQYFYKEVSVGELRAIQDLRRMGVRDPQAAISELIRLGLLEKGKECYNLAKPLREHKLNG